MRALSTWLVLAVTLAVSPAHAQDDEAEATDPPEPTLSEGAPAPAPPPEPAPEPEPEPWPDPVEAEVTGDNGAVEATGDAARKDNRAVGDDFDKDPNDAQGTPDWVDLGGYLNAGFGFVYIPEALPRDEFNYFFLGRAGLVVDARPFKMWKGRLNVVFDSQVLEAVTDVDVLDTDGDGTDDRLLLTKRQVPGTVLQDAWIAFTPAEWFEMRAGAMRMPFTLQQQSANTTTLFPNRSRPNEIFLSGADFGVLAQGNFLDGIIIPSLGVFAGTSLGLDVVNTVARGVVFQGRLDVNPFGDFPFGEGDPERGDFRLGLGFGAIVRPITLFDESTGTEGRGVVDVRMAGSLRMAVRGLYVAAEYFRRQQVDSFSFRPIVADGAYAQAAFFFPIVDSVALEPIARAGFVAEDQSFNTRLTGYLNGGISLYPVADVGRGDAVRLTLQYLGQRRFTEGEDAHGARARLRFKF